MTAFLIGSPPGAEVHMIEGIHEPPREEMMVLAPGQNNGPLFEELTGEPVIKMVETWRYRLVAQTPLGVTYKFVG